MKKDMCQPNWCRILAFTLFLIGSLLILLSFFVRRYFVVGVFGFAVFEITGLFAYLIWKNQWIEIVDDDEFIYSTAFGKQIRYHFSDIVEIRQNSDSKTVIMKYGKIHIEEVAYISDRLRKRLGL